MTRSRERAPCAVNGCKEASRAKGLCLNHYQKWRRDQTFAPSDRWLGPSRSVTFDLPMEDWDRIKKHIEPGGLARWLREAVTEKLRK